MENDNKLETKNGKNGIAIIIVLLAVLLIGGAGYIGYNEFFSGKVNSNASNSKNEKNKTELKDLDVNDSMVKSALENFETITQRETPEKSNLYVSPKFTVDDISRKNLALMAVQQMGIANARFRQGGNEDNGKRATIDEINNIVSKYILNFEKFTLSDFDNNQYTDEDDYSIKIDKENLIVYDIMWGYQIPTPLTITKTKTIKAQQEENKLYIYQKMAFGFDPNRLPNDRNNSNIPGWIFYTTRNSNGMKVESIEEDSDNNFVNEPTWEKYNTYKYTFEISNGNPYFLSIEQTN